MEEPWEALDVDDSDTSAFLRPCNAHTSSSSLIPGPAGAVQAVMSNRSRDHPLPTQEFIRRVGRESHRDFSTNPWLCAIQFVRSQGMVDADDAAHGTPLNSIKNIERVPLVVAVIKSCTPNGLGDMTITLKVLALLLLTATVYLYNCCHLRFVRRFIRISHFRILQSLLVPVSIAKSSRSQNLGRASLLILSWFCKRSFSSLLFSLLCLTRFPCFHLILSCFTQVAVFCPTRSACYLNVTVRNILQVCHRVVSVFHFRLLPIC